MTLITTIGTGVLTGVATLVIGEYLIWRIKTWNKYKKDEQYAQQCAGGTLLPVPLARRLQLFLYAY